MNRLGRLFALIAALGGFAAAHAVTQSGQAMELPPITSVTTVLPTLPLPPPPTTALPPPPTTAPLPLPPPPTTTAPLPVPVPPLPLPPVTTAPIVPAPLPPQTGTLPRIPPPAPAPSGTSPTPASPSTSSSSAPSSAASGSSGPAAAGRGTTTSSTVRSQHLRTSVRRTKGRVSVRLAFTLPQAARVFLVVRGPAPSCRVAGVIPVRGRRGANTVYFAGRVHGRRLEPGLYLISLSPTRRVDADARSELVRVVSRTRSVPAADSAPRPECTPAGTSGETTGQTLVREAPRTPIPPTVSPAAPLRPPLQDDADERDDSAGFLPIPGSLSPDTGTEAFAAIAIVMLVGALLLAMVALVTRFLRGSWNP